IATIFLILCVLICAFGLFDDMHYRFYKGDRITINITATIDGEFIESDNIKSYVTSDGNSEKTVLIKDNDDSVMLSVKAGEYGEYLVNTEICNYHFVFRAMQWNWWDVQNINLSVDIDTEKKEYTTFEEYSHISEEGNVVQASEPKETYEITDINHINVGCKG
ncbi:MAG: hypothetical protein K2F65_00820, partial [Eubacterium sp.]|nr:hypothetical protein [Eubacterium sp.]